MTRLPKITSRMWYGDLPSTPPKLDALKTRYQLLCLPTEYPPPDPKIAELRDDSLRLIRKAYTLWIDGLPEAEQSDAYRRCLARARKQEERAKDLEAREIGRALSIVA